MKHKSIGLRKSKGLKIFVFIIIFVMLFSVIGVVIIYLRGLQIQKEARQQIIEQQMQESEENSTVEISIPTLDTYTGGIRISTGENQNQ